MNIGILGIGEVGSAIKKLVEKKHRVFTADRKLMEKILDKLTKGKK